MSGSRQSIAGTPTALVFLILKAFRMHLNNLRSAKKAISEAFNQARIYSGNFSFLNPRQMTSKQVEAEFELQHRIAGELAMALLHAREVIDDLERYLIASELKRRELLKQLQGLESLDGMPEETAVESALENRPVGIS